MISIILPTFNGANYISEAIDSVIKQTYKNWELIVIDDCSSDSTNSIVEKYTELDTRIKLYKNEKNLKLPASLNYGFSLAKGDYLTWTSDDNIYKINALEKMVNELETNKNIDFVFARESITEKYLSEILDDNKHVQIPDMAFMLESSRKKFSFVDDLRLKSDELFGITVRNWKFPDLDNKQMAMENYINSVKDFMVKEFEKRKCTFVFIPQVTVSTGDDTIIAEKIKDRLPKKYKKQFIIRRDDWSPSEIKSLIANMDYFVGTRMHSNIFATSMAVPTTAIAYEKKTNGIMETVGLQNYVVEINDITAEDLYNKVEDMIVNKKKIKKQLSCSIKDIRKEILEKIEKVVK